MEPHPHALGAAPVRAPPLPAHLLQREIEYSSPSSDGKVYRTEPLIWEVKPCALAMSEMEQELVVSMKEKGHTLWLRCSKTHLQVQRFISDTLRNYAEPETHSSYGWFLTLQGADAGLVGWMFRHYRLLDCTITAHHIIDEGFVTELSPLSIEAIEGMAAGAATLYSNITSGLITKELSAGIDLASFKRDQCSQKCRKINCARKHENEKRRMDGNYLPVLCPSDQACMNQNCSHARNMIELKLHPSLFLTELCPRSSPDGICQNDFPCGGVHPGSPDIFYHHLWEDLFLEGLEKTFIFMAGAIRHCFKLRALPHRPVRILLLTPHAQTARLVQHFTKDLVGLHHLVAAPVGAVTGEVVLGQPGVLLPLLQQDGASLGDLAALVMDDAITLLTDPQHASHTCSLLRQITNSRQNGAGRLNSVLVADTLNHNTVALAQQLLQSAGFSHRFSMSGLVDDKPNKLWGDSELLQSSHGNTDVIARILIQGGVPSVLSGAKSSSFDDAKTSVEDASSASRHRSDSQASASQATENYTNDWAQQQATQLREESSRQNGSYSSDDASCRSDSRATSTVSHAAATLHPSESSHQREAQRGSDHGPERRGGKSWRGGGGGEDSSRRQEKEGRLREGGGGHAAWQLPAASPTLQPAQPEPAPTSSRYYSPAVSVAQPTAQQQQTAQQQLQLLQQHSQQQLQYNYALQLQQQYGQQQQQQYLQEVLQREQQQQQQQQQLQYSPAELQLAQQLQYNHAALQLSQQLQSYSPAAALQLQQLHEQQQIQYSHAALQQQYSQQQQQYILEVLQRQQQYGQASGSQASPSQYGLGNAGRGSHHDHNYKPY